MDTTTATTKEGMQVYELGFHIVPLISEENLAPEVETIKAMLEKHGATFISEDSPKMRPLAYPMHKKIEAVNHNFKSAYFGWVKFETSPSELIAIKSALDLNKNVLRFLLIKTVRENTLMAGRVIGVRGARVVRPEIGKETTTPIAPASVEEMDKSIDSLVIQ